MALVEHTSNDNYMDLMNFPHFLQSPDSTSAAVEVEAMDDDCSVNTPSRVENTEYNPLNTTDSIILHSIDTSEGLPRQKTTSEESIRQEQQMLSHRNFTAMGQSHEEEDSTPSKATSSIEERVSPREAGIASARMEDLSTRSDSSEQIKQVPLEKDHTFAALDRDNLSLETEERTVDQDLIECPTSSQDEDRRIVPEDDEGLLPAEHFAEAEQDLHEKQEWIQRDVQALRELVLKEEGLRSRTDSSFLLTFLRARKFDYDKALNMIVGYYRARQINQSFYNGLTASSLQHVWDKQLQTVLPGTDYHGRTVLIFRAGAWSPSTVSLDDMFRAQVLLLEHVVRCPVTQLKGVAAVVDCAGLGMTHACNLTAAHIKRMVAIVQEVFPLRFKALHFINEPNMFEWMFSLVKPLLSDTIRGRLHFHGNNCQSLHKHIPAAGLPSQLGGEGGPLDNSSTVDLLDQQQQYFMDHFSYGYTSSEITTSTSSNCSTAASKNGAFLNPGGTSTATDCGSTRPSRHSAPLPSSATFTEGLTTTHLAAAPAPGGTGHVTSSTSQIPSPTSASNNAFLGSVADVGSFLGSYYRRMCIE